jgi:transcriptional regulator with GAF, ATPase, and Fis domain
MSSAIVHPTMAAHGSIAIDPISVLLVSPNPDLRRNLASRLQSSRWDIQEVSSGASALERITDTAVSLVLLDQALPDLKVDEFKQFMATDHPTVEVISLNPHTGQPIVAVHPDSAGFELVRTIEHSGPFKFESADPLIATSSLKPEPGLPGMVGTASAMRQVSMLVRLLAPRDTTVLITGESGTGKDLVAHAIHDLSHRRHKPFVVINCAAIPEPLLEAELFGFVKGSFTGAVQSRVGRIHAAQGGTLFLDEIGDLAMGLQAKLLRFLEAGEIQRLGSTDTFRVDVRVVAATNSNLRRQVQERNFREDLFYRLSVFPIDLPPLRERMSDLISLTQAFLTKFCAHSVSLTPESIALLQQHTWPGNIRELRNVMERASILAGADREIRPEHIVI